MKVSYNWLQTFFDTQLPDPEKVAKELTFHSFEVESLESNGDDFIIDIDILPNRSSDCLSHRGIAKELSVILGTPLANDPFKDIPKVESDGTILTKDHVNFSVEDYSICRRATKHLAVDVVVDESPKWLKDRLEALGQRPINNIVDTTNYVSLFLGQPVHAFDFDKIAGKDKKDVTIRFAKKGEKVESLDEKKYELDETIPVIADSSGPLDIAGIKGGIHSGVDKDTSRVLLSACSFDPTIIRRASNKLRLRTDASSRFENNVPPDLAGIAIGHSIELLKEYAGARIASDTLDIYPEKEAQKNVHVRSSKINALLGANISKKEAEDIFTRFGFEFSKKQSSGDDQEYSVTIPFERTDLNISEDLVEEVGRVYGYEKINAEPLSKYEGEIEINKRFYYSEMIRKELLSRGFSEVYMYTFRDRGKVQTTNALASDKSWLRESLREGILEGLKSNRNNAPLLCLEDIRIFEFGNVFGKNRENTVFALGVSALSKKQKHAENVIGESIKALESAMGVPLLKYGDIEDGILEINFTEYIDSLPEPQTYEKTEKQQTVKYTPFSVYPFVLRDIALWVPEGVKYGDVEAFIREKSGKLLSSTALFDTFSKEGRVSYAFRLVFQSYEKTLSDAEINTVMEGVTDALNTKEGFEVR